MGIRESAMDAITSIAQSDFIRAVTAEGASKKATLANVAKAIIESYTGSTLAGAAQSVKAAIDTLNTSKQPKTMSQTIAGSATVEGALSALNSKKISYAEETYTGTFTIPSSCYLNIAKGTEPFREKKIVAIQPISWGVNNGPINITSDTGGFMYLTGREGDFVTNLILRVWYLDG